MSMIIKSLRERNYRRRVLENFIIWSLLIGFVMIAILAVISSKGVGNGSSKRRGPTY